MCRMMKRKLAFRKARDTRGAVEYRHKPLTRSQGVSDFLLLRVTEQADKNVSPPSRRSPLGIASIGMRFWRRRRARILLDQTQCLSDAALKLWIKATSVILWR